ncbi:MAG: serine hydrolase [Actinomycetota bacterium]
MARPLAIDDLFAFRLPSDPHLSPDGTKLAFTLTSADEKDDKDHSSIWVADTTGGNPWRLTQGAGDRSPRWAPDGAHLAFVASKEEDSAPQLYVLPSAGGEARRLTELPLGAGEPVWSPDGKRIAFAAAVDIDRDPKSAPDPTSNEPIVVNRVDQKADGNGYLGGFRQHVFVIDLDGGEPRQLTTGDFHSSTPVWSPDSRRLAFSTSMAEDRDLEIGSVTYVVDVDGGTPEPVTPDDGLFGVVAWSPDGSSLLLAGMEHIGVGLIRLFTVDAAGGTPRELMPGYDRNVMTGAPAYPGATPAFVDDGNRILFCARDRGRVHILSVPSAGGDPEVVIGGDRIVAGMSTAAGKVAFVAATWESPGELHVLDGDGNERTLTALFHDALPDVEITPGEERWFTAPDGTRIEGWVLRDAAAERGPLLLDIHGGPHNAWGPALDSVHLYQQALVAQGWTILCINPRGSDGYGETFWSALVENGWGHDDEQDFICAIDALIADDLVDPDRIAVTGYSYGGQMTCWLTARTDRFAAAVGGGCVSDHVSMSGTSDLGWYIRAVEFQRTNYADDQRMLVERSPITHVANVSAPTLLLHGAKDDRCPPGQAEQWFTALRSRRVPAELVLYPGGSHLFILNGPPSHRIDYCRRVQDWVVRHTSDKDNGAGPRSLAARLRGFESWFAGVVDRHPVPGASIAVLHGDELLTAATGVLDVDTKVEATTDSLFQIGSISKVYTTTMVMQLVDEGAFELDTPVVEVLPEFSVADADVTRTVTIRNLLTHTSGIQGDHFPETGRGDDAVERYVATCTELGQSHPLGATMSYCNTGFVVAGRVIEKVTGMSWHATLQERLLRPAGLDASVTLPEDALRFRVAFGHTKPEGEGVKRVGQWMLPWSCAPAGLISATAADVVRFGKIHLGDGRATNGTQILSPGSVKTMQIEQVAVPEPYTHGSHWGVGWILFDWDGRRIFGHDGGTLGQLAYFRVLPEANLAVALLTNSDASVDLYHAVMSELFGTLAGVAMPSPPQPLEDPGPIDVAKYAGAYEREAQRYEITERDGDLVLKSIVTGPLAELLPDPVEEFVMQAAGEDTFVVRVEGRQAWSPMVFYQLDDGTPYIHFGARATPKVS